MDKIYVAFNSTTHQFVACKSMAGIAKLIGYDTTTVYRHIKKNSGNNATVIKDYFIQQITYIKSKQGGKRQKAYKFLPKYSFTNLP